MDVAVQFPTTPRALKAVPVKLSRRMSAEQAFERIIAGCLSQVTLNGEGVARFHDVECLHQMRVGLRRLRAALAMYQDWLVLPPSISNELDWLVGELGPARDWDVFIESTLPGAERSVADGAPVRAVAAAARDSAAALHEHVVAALASARYGDLINALQGWLERRAWREVLSQVRQADLTMRATKVAATILKDDQKRLLKRGRKLAEGGAAERHRLRIAAKRTRYAAEFFSSLFPRRRVRPYVAALARLQDELGAMNDAAVADRFLAELAGRDDSVAADANFVRGYLAGRSHDSADRVRVLWKKFRPLRPPHR